MLRVAVMIYAATLALGFLAGGHVPGSTAMRGSSAVMQATEVYAAGMNRGGLRSPPRPAQPPELGIHIAAALLSR